MAEPPASPASSDITGVHRDEPKLVAENKTADTNDLQQLAQARPRSTARPLEDTDMNQEGNPQ